MCLCPPQSVRSNASWLVRTRGTAATASAWGAAPNPTTTWPAQPASTTATRAAACPTVPREPSGSRAGAASPWTSVHRCTCPATLASSCMTGNACLSVPPVSRATRLIGKHPTVRLFGSAMWSDTVNMWSLLKLIIYVRIPHGRIYIPQAIHIWICFG